MVPSYKLDHDIFVDHDIFFNQDKQIRPEFFEGYLSEEKVRVVVRKSSQPFHEAKFLEKFSNKDGFVKFYGMFQSERDYYLVFEYFCYTLEDFVEKKNIAENDEIRKKELVHEIAKAMHFLHSKNICK